MKDKRQYTEEEIRSLLRLENSLDFCIEVIHGFVIGIAVALALVSATYAISSLIDMAIK